MNIIRFVTGFALAIYLMSFSLASAAPAERHWLVLPFENESDQPEYHWLGEGLALMLSDALSIPGVEVITPEQRRAVLERLSFPEGAVLSRASAIRVAQEVGADLLLVGGFKVTGAKGGEQVAISAKLIDVPAGRLAQDPFDLKAPLKELVELQALLAWDVLVDQQALITISRNRFVSRFAGITKEAFEAYVKAVLVQDLSTRAELLQLALERVAASESHPLFPSAIYELGKMYYQQQNYAAAISKLTQLKPGQLYFRESQFYLGVCYFQQGEVDKALAIYRQLKETLPIASVFNNLAVLEIRGRHLAQAFDHLTFALAADGGNADIWFNYGYALWLNRDFEAAAMKLRLALERRPDDGQAQYLLAKCLAEMGREKEAQSLLRSARNAVPAVGKWEQSGQVPMLARVQKDFSRLALLPSRRAGEPPGKPPEAAVGQRSSMTGSIVERLRLLMPRQAGSPGKAQTSSGGTRRGSGGDAQAKAHRETAAGWQHIAPPRLTLTRLSARQLDNEGISYGS